MPALSLSPPLTAPPSRLVPCSLASSPCRRTLLRCRDKMRLMMRRGGRPRRFERLRMPLGGCCWIGDAGEEILGDVAGGHAGCWGSGVCAGPLRGWTAPYAYHAPGGRMDQAVGSRTIVRRGCGQDSGRAAGSMTQGAGSVARLLLLRRTQTHIRIRACVAGRGPCDMDVRQRDVSGRLDDALPGIHMPPPAACTCGAAAVAAAFAPACMRPGRWRHRRPDITWRAEPLGRSAGGGGRLHVARSDPSTWPHVAHLVSRGHVAACEYLARRHGGPPAGRDAAE